MFPTQLPLQAVYFKRFVQQKRPGQLALRVDKGNLEFFQQMIHCSILAKGHLQGQNLLQFKFINEYDKKVDMGYLSTLILYGLGLRQLKLLQPLLLYNLTHFELHYNSLQSLQDLLPIELPSLKFLYLQMNKIESLQHFDQMKCAKLKSIYLSSVQFKKGKNKITDISNVLKWKFHQLKQLILSENKICDLFDINSRDNLFFTNRVITSLKSLTCLNLHSNQISSIEKLQFFSLPNLQELDLSSNYISTIKSLIKIEMPIIKKINIRKNQIVEIDFIQKIQKYTKLKAFSLQFNKFSNIFQPFTKYSTIWLKKTYKNDKNLHNQNQQKINHLNHHNQRLYNNNYNYHQFHQTKMTFLPQFKFDSIELIEETFGQLRQILFEKLQFDEWDYLIRYEDDF